MSRKLFALFAALFCVAALANADDNKEDKTKPAKAKVEAVRVEVARKLDEKQFGFSYDQTQVGLLVQLAGKQLLGIDPTSKVDTFSDDKGTSLLTTEGFFRTTFNFPRLSTDRESMLVSVASNKAVTRGATKVTTKGELVAVIGTEVKSSEEVAVKFAKDTKVKVGEMSLEVTSDKALFGNDGASFSVKTTGTTVKSVTVKDADGKAVEVSSNGRYGFGKDWSHNFNLKKVVKEGKVTITYFSKEEKVSIPIDIAVTLGP